jgi:hypothetical protein
MRSGQNGSSRFQKGFEPNAHVKAALEAAPEAELRDTNCFQDNA